MEPPNEDEDSDSDDDPGGTTAAGSMVFLGFTKCWSCYVLFKNNFVNFCCFVAWLV